MLYTASKLKNGSWERPQNEAKDLHLYYMFYITCTGSYKNGNHGSQSETSWKSWWEKTFLKVHKENFLKSILHVVMFLNQATKGQTWAWEHSESDSESPLPLAVCLPSICLLICCAARNQNWGRLRLWCMSCWSQEIVRAGLSHHVLSLPPQTVCLPSCCL